MARVLAISSQVARGAIGLSAAVPALQALGHEVVALPTILLSNHPGHAHFAGERVSAPLLHRMLDALDTNGWLAGLDGILTGYLPSAEHVTFAAKAVQRAKQRSPASLYLCDPVLGDDPKGVYIAPDAAAAVRDILVPVADVLKMNRFEAEWLTSRRIENASAAADAATAAAWSSAIVTSLSSVDSTRLSNALVKSGSPPVSFETTRRHSVPNGTGDLLGALWLGHRLRNCSDTEALEKAVTGVACVLAHSQSADELQLVAALGEIAR